MRYRPFGRTGLTVSVVGFGCWPMAGDRYGAIEDDEAVRAIHRVGARTPAEVDANDSGAELDLSAAERKIIEGILAGAAGRVREFTPLLPAMQPWGEEIPAG